MLDYKNLDIVDKTIENITIVGEIHQNEEYQSLVSNIIEINKPDIIGVESATTYPFCISGGIPQSKQYASDLDCKIVTLDQNEEWMHEKLDDKRMSAVYYGNQLSSLVEDMGDITPSIVSDARNNVRDNLGEYVFRVLFTEREILMSRRLKYVNNKYPEKNIVVVVGGFHIYALKELYDIVDYIECDHRISESSIHNPWRKNATKLNKE